MANMMTNDGSTVPRAVTRLPRMPRSLYKDRNVYGKNAWGGLGYGKQIDKVILGNPVPFGYDFVFDQRHHSIAASDSEGTNLEKDAECFKINIHLTYCSYSLFLFLLFLYILFSALFTIFAGAHFEMFLKHFPEVFDIVESRQFGYFGDRVLTGL